MQNHAESDSRTIFKKKNLFSRKLINYLYVLSMSRSKTKHTKRRKFNGLWSGEYATLVSLNRKRKLKREKVVVVAVVAATFSFYFVLKTNDDDDDDYEYENNDYMKTTTKFMIV